MDAADFQGKIIELLSAIDWKLWELYKIEQERSKRESQVHSAGMRRAQDELNAAETESELVEPPKKARKTRKKTKPETDATGLEYTPVRVEE